MIGQVRIFGAATQPVADFGVFGGLRRPKGRGVEMGGRTLSLSTDLTEEDFMEGAGIQKIFMYMESGWLYLLH